MDNVNKAFLGIGSNLNDPAQQLVDARSALLKWPATHYARCSSFYLSSPVGYSNQPNFLNCVLELGVTANLEQLFAFTQSIEERMGRIRDAANQNAPRVIDIDILLFGNQRCDSERLTVPHPRIEERLFVLEPLAELMRDNTHPILGPVDELIDRGDFSGQHLHRLSFRPQVD